MIDSTGKFEIVGEAHVLVDEQARVRARSERDDHELSLLHIVESLTAAPSGAARGVLVRAMLNAIGFDWFCYCRLTRMGDQLRHAVYFGEYAPPGWPGIYLARSYVDVDPRIAFASRHEWPLVWDLASLPQTGSNSGGARAHAQLGRFLGDADRAAVRSGITFGFASPGSRDHSIVSFASSNPTRSWIVDAVIGQAYAAGLGLHEFLTTQARLQTAPSKDPQLSAIQRRILAWLTDGLNDREIAAQLNLSAHNVDYHVRQLKKKYEARNRVQLAYLAGREADR